MRRSQTAAIWRAFAIRWPRGRRYRIVDHPSEGQAHVEQRRRLQALIDAKKKDTDRDSRRAVAAASRELTSLDAQWAETESFVAQVIAELPRRRIANPVLEPIGPEWDIEEFERPQGTHRLYSNPFSQKATAVMYRVALPSGGIFVPVDRDHSRTSDTYDPLGRDGDNIFLDLQAIRFNDAADLLGFVNEWGTLGVGIPGAPNCRADGVELTGQLLAKLARWLRAIREARGRSGELTRAHVSDELLAELAVPLGSQSAIDYIKNGRFRLPSLWSALCLRLWESAHGELRLRPCANDRCRRLFVVRRKTQRFCTWACGNRWTVRRWKRRQRRERR